MLEFGDLIRSRSSSFRQIRTNSCSHRKKSCSDRNHPWASSSQSSSPEHKSPLHAQPFGMFLLVPAVHARSSANTVRTVVVLTNFSIISHLQACRKKTRQMKEITFSLKLRCYDLTRFFESYMKFKR